VQIGHQAQVERSTRISAIEPSFKINDGLLLYSSEIMEHGNLNGLVKLIRLETLIATAPTFQLKRFHFSSPIPCSKNSHLLFSYQKTNHSITLPLLLFVSFLATNLVNLPLFRNLDAFMFELLHLLS
jgi:hypothetical protein